MTPNDIGQLLAKAAAFDQRTVGDVDVMAWFEAIGDLDTADALTAVSRYYGTVTGRRLMPSDVRMLADEIRRERHRAKRLAIEAAAAHPADDRPLTDRRPEIRAFVAEIRDALPDSGPDVLRPRAAHWRQEHAVHRDRPDATPNPDYDPALGTPVDWQRPAGKPEPAWWEDPAARERHAVEELARAGRLTLARSQ